MSCSEVPVERERAKVKLGIVIASDDPETVWNAFRLANVAASESDTVCVFLLGRGVACRTLDTDRFAISSLIGTLLESGASVRVCRTCLEARRMAVPEGFVESNLVDLHDLIRESDRLLSF